MARASMFRLRLIPRQAMKAAFLIGLMVISLSHCGWRLRGTGAGAEDLPPLVLQGDSERFMHELRQALKEHGLRTEPTSDSHWTVIIRRHDFQRRLAAVSGRGQAQSFLLVLRMEIQFSDPRGNSRPAQTLDASRDMPYDQSAILGKDAEEQIMQKSLLRDVSLQLIHRYKATIRQGQKTHETAT